MSQSAAACKRLAAQDCHLCWFMKAAAVFGRRFDNVLNKEKLVHHGCWQKAYIIKSVFNLPLCSLKDDYEIRSLRFKQLLSKYSKSVCDLCLLGLLYILSGTFEK